MDWDSFWSGLLWGAGTIIAITILVLLINISRVRLYDYPSNQQTCVTQDRQILRCYAVEPE